MEKNLLSYIYQKDFRFGRPFQTDQRPGLTVKIYTFDKPRHANLECMEKLRGPNKINGTVGVVRGNLFFLRLKMHVKFIVSAS